MLKQNKGELKRLKKKEMKIYLKCEKLFTIMQGGFFSGLKNEGDWPGRVIRVITLKDIRRFSDLFTIKNIYEFSDLTEEEQLVLHKRSLDVAKKRRKLRRRLTFITVLVIYLPMILLPIIIITIIK